MLIPEQAHIAQFGERISRGKVWSRSSVGDSRTDPLLAKPTHFVAQKSSVLRSRSKVHELRPRRFSPDGYTGSTSR